MSQTNSTFNDSPSAEKSFPWGCVLGGCATVLLLIVVGVFATALRELSIRSWAGRDVPPQPQPGRDPGR